MTDRATVPLVTAALGVIVGVTVFPHTGAAVFIAHVVVTVLLAAALTLDLRTRP